MDESSNSISPDELDPRSAPDRTSAIADALPAELVEWRERAAPGQQRHSEPIRLCQNEPQFGASVAVYCGTEEAVYLGFRIALSAMATAAFEDLAAKPQGAKP